MKPIYFTLFSCIFLMLSCGDKNFESATDGLDAARKFIAATLKGDKKTAKYYMLNDSINNFILEKWQEKYRFLSEEEKLKYKQASIIIKKDSIINDSTEIISFENSYKKTPFIIQVNKRNNRYFVDLKCTFYRDSCRLK